jgi:UDP-3-O-[3-hydroxymyristoyl] glucosamine N-acyltransferase
VVIGAGAVIGPEVYLESDVDIAGGVKLERVVATRGASLRQDASDLVVTGVKS